MMIQLATGKSMGDYGCMLRAYRRHIVEAMLHCHERSTFIPILANTFARRTTEIDVRHAEREFGDSKYSLMKLINLMYDLITCLTTTPLRLLSVVGSIVALSGFVLALVLIALRLLLGPEWAAGGVFTLFAVLFTFSAPSLLAWGYWVNTSAASIPTCAHVLAILFRKWSAYSRTTILRKKNDESYCICLP